MTVTIPPASARNSGPITEVLSRVFAPVRARKGLVLEIASGSGYHASVFAKAFPELTWQPSDADAGARDNIAAHRAEAGLPNFNAPLTLDVESPWPLEQADAVVCINMIHISPWSATLALFKGAARILPAGGLLVTYGPYALNGDFRGQGNIDFDASLKNRNPSWGIREVKDVVRVGMVNGFTHRETVEMPTNNLILVFDRNS
jgi:cyclopropane fatty-acyl-phospholipid synthase-like methyltransferase